MSYIYAVTSLQLDPGQTDAIAQAIARSGLAGQFTMGFKQYPAEFCAGLAVDQITFFLCVPDDTDVGKRRELNKLLNDTMISVTGYKGEFKVIVIFWPYESKDALMDGKISG